MPAREVRLSEALCWAETAGRLATAAAARPAQRTDLRLVEDAVLDLDALLLVEAGAARLFWAEGMV